LINQTSDTLDQFNIPHGVIQGNHWRYRPYERIQVASPQTLARRKWPEDLELIIIDECHTIHKTVKDKLLKETCFSLGLTATPLTKGLGKIYNDVVTVRTLKQLTDQDFLTPFRVFAASEPDMKGAKIVAGEWTDNEAAERSMKIVGDCVNEYIKHGEDRKFIAFGCNVAHCEEISKQFLLSGIITETFTYKTPDSSRESILSEFRKPDSRVRGLISVSALSKGFDVPDVSCIIMARPLRKSLSEHIQILGRGLRIFPG
jgi:superfamily II DNA or RNA helicase